MSGTPRTSDDEMDVGRVRPEAQQRERLAVSKIKEKPKKPLPRITAPKDNT